MLRWHLQHGITRSPSRSAGHRIAENFDLFDFSLSADDMAAIDALDTGVRGGPGSREAQPRHAPQGRRQLVAGYGPARANRAIVERRGRTG